MLDIVFLGRRDDETVDTLGKQSADGRSFRNDVFTRVNEDDGEACLPGNIRDASHGKAEKGVFNISHHDADGA